MSSSPKIATQASAQGALSKLDFVVENSYDSEQTSNNLGSTILAWYANDTLKLAGFIQSANSNSIVNEIVLKGVTQRPHLTGFVISAQAALARFEEAADGPEAFVAFISGRFSSCTSRLEYLNEHEGGQHSAHIVDGRATLD